MAHYKTRKVLTGITVNECMRMQVSRLPVSAPISKFIRNTIKQKISATLVDDNKGKALGVVSKTDIISAYYAGFPIETPIGDIMTAPPDFCYPDDQLEEAIDNMRHSGNHRLYVLGASDDEIIGTLSYSDIVGLMYRYCRNCIKSRRKSDHFTIEDIPRLIVKEVMTEGISTCQEDTPIIEAAEILLTQKLGAILIQKSQEEAIGVISRTDLIIAFLHEIETIEPVGRIMNSPVVFCNPQSILSEAIQQMFLSDVQRLFVSSSDSKKIIGVLALSDAACFRSGTCKACTASKLIG
ncbi:MAG: CBS domain-containing protein [Desulfobacteraceae bacterium]|nr:CBS domain-containing protein [Desulfobacteraceae bacterium]